MSHTCHQHIIRQRFKVITVPHLDNREVCSKGVGVESVTYNPVLMLVSLTLSAEFTHDLKLEHCARLEIYTVKVLRIDIF